MYQQQGDPGYDRPPTNASGVYQPLPGSATSFEDKLQPPPACVYPSGHPGASQESPVRANYPQPDAPSLAQGYVHVQPMLLVEPMQAPPSDCLGCSIFALLCCCWCIGLAALLKSIKCKEAIARGDMAAAVKHSKSAHQLIVWSVVCGIVLCVVVGVLRVFLIMNEGRNNY